MITFKFPLAAFLLLPFLFGGCRKDNGEAAPEIPFDITGYYVAGTITPASNSYTSVYLIRLLEHKKAVFISSGNDFTGNYTLTNDSLVVIVNDPDNYREARFAINGRHQLTAARYKALAMEYAATGTLLKIENKNQFAGKIFGGSEYKMGPVINKESWYYKFDAEGTKYGSGESASLIEAANSMEVINNSAFKFKNGATTELGFISGDSLTVFRYGGLYYFGKYGKQ